MFPKFDLAVHSRYERTLQRAQQPIGRHRASYFCIEAESLRFLKSSLEPQELHTPKDQESITAAKVDMAATAEAFSRSSGKSWEVTVPQNKILHGSQWEHKVARDMEMTLSGLRSRRQLPGHYFVRSSCTV